MLTTQQALIIWGPLIVGTPFMIVYLFRRSTLKDKGLLDQSKEVKFLKRYDFYINNFITSKSFHTVVRSHIALSCLTSNQVKIQSVKLYEKAVGIATIIPIFLLVTTQDATLTLLGMLAGVVYYQTFVDSQIDKVYKDLIEDISVFLQTIELNYKESNNISKSILEADTGRYLNSVANEIYGILSDNDSERRLREFIAKSPLKLLSVIAKVAFVTVEYGDSYDDRGMSKFVQQIGVIKREVNLEIRTQEQQHLKFKSLPKIALAGLIAMPLIDIYLLKQIPGTAVYIRGVFGLTVKVAIILLTIAAYYIISTFNRKTVVTQTDFSEIVYSVSQDKRFRKYLEGVKPKKYKSMVKLEMLLENSLSAHSIDTFYTAKVLNALVAGIAGLVIAIVFIISARYFVYNNTGSLAMTPILVEERVQEDIDEMDKKFMEMDEKPVGEALVTFVDGNVRGLDMWQVKTQVQRLEKKWEIYQGISFKWFYVLIIYGIGMVGWFLPNLKIRLRKYLVKFESEDDASQLQTVMVTIAGTGMSVYEVLYNLSDLATIHNPILSYACQAYTRDPEFALTVLEESSEVTEFKHMCIKLKKSVYSIPLSEAFSNVVLEKEQSIALKDLHMTDMIRKKGNIATLISMAPFAFVLLFQTLGPMLLLGLSQFADITTQIGAM